MSTVLITLLFLLNALFMPLVVEFVKERAPKLALGMIRVAVRLLPRAHRDRYREEWTSELDEMERQNVSQLVSSLRILLSAPSMGWVLRARDRRQLTRLIEHSTRIESDASPLVHAFAQSLINQVSQFLKELSEGGVISYDGEDRDWVLGLTMQSLNNIDAISLSTMRADGKDFDGGLWTSDFGLRYLELQRDAMRRGVVIRRVFITDQSALLGDQDNLPCVCRHQKDLGIHVKVLDQSAIPDAIKSLMFDFVVFDSVASYEALPASRHTKSTTVKTRLALQPDRVEERMRQFEDLWSAGREID
jgi:hypothetical protein